MAALVVSIAPLNAQFQMPDVKQMSGIPRPVDDLPTGSISVRLVRGSLSNNITNHAVELRVGDKTLTAKTDDAGRAQFDKLTPGAPAKASADVDGERLESQEFAVPTQGGIRLILAATDTSKGPATEPNAPAVSGQVVLGGNTRFVMEPADEAVGVYYLLDIQNTARTPVNPPQAFAFDLPADATGCGTLEGSSPLAKVNGTHVQVQGPFPPGGTPVQIGCEVPATTGSITVTQRFPANVERITLIAKKVGDMKLVSPQLTSQQDMAANGETYIAATGGAVAAGQLVSLSLEGLPRHNPAPRWIALVVATLIIGIGVWVAAGTSSDPAGRSAERQKLTARRDRLFTDLARLERDRRRGKVDDQRYAERREELVAALEHVYGALDDAAAGSIDMLRAS